MIIAGAASGCIISSGNDGGGSATITAHWDIKQVNGTSLSCPPTYDTAALYSQEIDANYNEIGPPVIDLFDCNAFTADSAPLNPTTYYSWIAIETHDGSQTYASTTQNFVDLTVSDKTYSADIYDDGGYFQMAWQLQGASSNAPLLCADVAGIGGVESIATVTGGSQAIVDKFQCSDHYGLTAVLPEGSYTVSVDAFRASDNAALGAPVNLTNQTISGPNKVTNLHTITLPIDGL
ncbi:MAG TPA: hypothetical protein VIV58_14010 [Kofleriaceae bacterium]